MMRTLKVALAIALLCTTAAAAEWKIKSQSNESSTDHLVTHQHLVLENSGASESATLEIAAFTNKTAELRVLDDPAASSSLGAMMQRENCIAGVNGGYFDPDYKPVGLLVSDGRLLAPLQKARLLSGVVSLTSGRLQIQRASAFSLKTKPSAARQCGPFLVERG